MVSPLCKLGRFLHPLYRDVISSKMSNWIEVQRTAGTMWNDGYNKQPAKTEQLLKDIQLYRLYEDPFEAMPCHGKLTSLKLNRNKVADANPEAELSELPILTLDNKSHAASLEKTVSMLGGFIQPRRSQLLCNTTAGMTTVKLFQ